MKGRIFLILCGLLIIATFMLPAGTWAQSVRGVTDTEILVGQTGPQTGPAALWGAVARGTGLYFKGINLKASTTRGGFTEGRSNISSAMIPTPQPKPKPLVKSSWNKLGSLA